MAFLDNSGDIILDAVLTTEGRRRMAAGSFRISEYGFCDDEIDYSQFVAATGSAFQDLTILQTPVFESMTQQWPQSTLIAQLRNDVLYMPIIEVNNLCQASPAETYDGVYYVAANQETYDALVAATALGAGKYVMKSNSTTGHRVIWESGLHGAADDGILGTLTNRNNYLVTMNMIDDRYYVYADNRFVASLLGPKATSKMRNLATGADDTSISLAVASSVSRTGWMDNYNTYSLKGLPDMVTYNATSPATNISVINGPRATFSALGMSVDTELTSVVGSTRSAKFELYGSIAQDLFSDGNTYDYIDTPIWIQGNTTLRQLKINFRIIRRAS